MNKWKKFSRLFLVDGGAAIANFHLNLVWNEKETIEMNEMKTYTNESDQLIMQKLENWFHGGIN